MIFESIENIYFYNLDCSNQERQKMVKQQFFEVAVECVDDVNFVDDVVDVVVVVDVVDVVVDDVDDVNVDDVNVYAFWKQREWHFWFHLSETLCDQVIEMWVC